MNDRVFGEVKFDTGWYRNETILYCGTQYEIYICANSYRETDLITDNQRMAYTFFVENKVSLEQEIESLLVSYGGEDFLKQLKPTGLVIERDGGCAILFDDASDLDNGIAVTLAPDKEVMTQDDYL